MERDANVPAPNDTVITNGWLRPRLLGHLSVLFVSPQGKGQWKNIYWKRKKNNHSGKCLAFYKTELRDLMDKLIAI